MSATKTLGETLKIISTLYHTGVMDCPLDKVDGYLSVGIRYEQPVNQSDGSNLAPQVVVGVAMTRDTAFRDEPDFCQNGRGPDLEAAVADWQARVVRAAKKRIADGDALRQWMKERNLLG